MAPSRPRSLRNLAFGSRRNVSPGPPSPTFSETTNISAMNFGADGPAKIITRANLKASLQAYEDLMDTCAGYRLALMNISKATAAFADAMETCSGLKGPSYEAGVRLQAASGLHHLIGNHWHVLAETLDKNFEKPLRQHLEGYRTIITDRSSSYERALREKSQIIRDTEMRSMNRKERNLQSFREALVVLQRQVDDLDELKVQHYQEIMEHEEEVWDVVQGKICLTVRSTMDVFDRFTAKASDPVIEPMLQSVPDPFDSYGPPQSEDQIFSILPPLSIMTNVPSASPSPHTRTPELEAFDSLPTFSTSRTNSWIGDTSNDSMTTQTAEWAEIPSPTSPTTPRSVSPASSLPRRPSVGTTGSGHHSRKSDSKLRSVLSVIDETNKSRNVNGGIDGLPSRSSSTFSITNGGTIKQPKPEKSSSFAWSSPFSYGQSPYTDADHDDTTTPRHSSFHASQLEPPDRVPPDHTEGKEPNEKPTPVPVTS